MPDCPNCGLPQKDSDFYEPGFCTAERAGWQAMFACANRAKEQALEQRDQALEQRDQALACLQEPGWWHFDLLGWCCETPSEFYLIVDRRVVGWVSEKGTDGWTWHIAGWEDATYATWDQAGTAEEAKQACLTAYHEHKNFAGKR